VFKDEIENQVSSPGPRDFTKLSHLFLTTLDGDSYMIDTTDAYAYLTSGKFTLFDTARLSRIETPPDPFRRHCTSLNFYSPPSRRCGDTISHVYRKVWEQRWMGNRSDIWKSVVSASAIARWGPDAASKDGTRYIRKKSPE